MDYSSAAEWLDQMSDREKQKMQQTVFRRQMAMRSAKGKAAQLKDKTPPPTLATIKGPTLAEIEAKYGRDK